MSSVPERLLTADEVADVFRVDPRTVYRWAAIGRIKAVLTPGGRLKRFRASDVAAAMQDPTDDEGPAGAVNTARAQ